MKGEHGQYCTWRVRETAVESKFSRNGKIEIYYLRSMTYWGPRVVSRFPVPGIDKGSFYLGFRV